MRTRLAVSRVKRSIHVVRTRMTASVMCWAGGGQTGT